MEIIYLHLCEICKKEIYRFDKACMNCLNNESIELIKKNEELLKKINEEIDS